MAKSTKSTLLLTGATALVTAGVLLLVLPRPGERSNAVHKEGFDLEGHLARVKQWDPEKGFDTEAHAAALKQVGPIHQDALKATAHAHAALSAREKALLQESTVGATLDQAIQQVREQLAVAKQMADAADHGEAATASPPVDVVPDVALLRTQLAAKEAELNAFYGQDDVWQKLHAAYEEANVARQQANVRLQAVIRARMQVESEIERAKRKATDMPQEGEQP